MLPSFCPTKQLLQGFTPVPPLAHLDVERQQPIAYERRVSVQLANTAAPGQPLHTAPPDRG